MLHFQNLAPAGAVVIAIICILFIAAVLLLFYVYTRYRALQKDMTVRDGSRSVFAGFLREDFSAAYR